MGNLEVIHIGTPILYEWDILGSSIYIVDILGIHDLRIDDQSSILRSSIYRVFESEYPGSFFYEQRSRQSVRR